MTLRNWTILGVPAVAACGCGSDDDQVDIEATTYNAGLAVGFVDYAAQRSQVTANALAALPTKILCVQEFWKADDVAKLKAATVNSLPHTIFPAPQQEFVSGEAQCTTADLANLTACVEQKCECTPNDQLANCTLGNCLPQFFAVPPKCAGCLQANVGLVAALGLDRIIAACTATQTWKYAYDGSFGTGLLTKYDILEQQEVVMPSHTNRRGLIYAKLKTEVGDLHAICTQQHNTPPSLASVGTPSLSPRVPNVIGCALSDPFDPSCPRKRASMPTCPSASPRLDSLYSSGNGGSGSPQADGQSEGRRGAAPSGLAAVGWGAVIGAARPLQLVENRGRGGGSARE